MILCNDECIPMCDFCTYMEQHSAEEESFGTCFKHNQEIEFLHDYCEDFQCIRVIK